MSALPAACDTVVAALRGEYDDRPVHQWRCDESFARMMLEAQAAFEERVERVAESYARANGYSMDHYLGHAHEPGSDVFTANYRTYGCCGGPDEDDSQEIPIRYLWMDDQESWTEMVAQREARDKARRLEKERAIAAQQERDRLAEERRARSEYERLRARFEGEGR